MDVSVKVGVRVRPLSENEVNDGCCTCLSYPLEENQLIIGNDKLFGFDFIFKETDSQECVYKKAAFPMVENVLKGYNATLFAYGQTGSGKTYTMGTYVSENLSENSVGIVPRIIKDLFDRMPDCEYEYTVKVSFLEIYKEDIHDLLSEDASASLQIREENQLVKIPGLTETLVTCPEEVLNLLQSGSAKRSVGSTAMNMKSSRSHAILTLNFLLRPKVIECGAESTEGTLTAKLHLVDLAGSERLKKTHAEGDRLKEGIDINRGLLALGNVISALCERDAKKRSHIPYRDSRLTRLLQDSLGGNSATLMLACVSPADMNMEETLNTLRYADRARLIKNKPILNRADPKDAELARLRTLVAQLQSQLTNGSSFPLLSPCAKLIKPMSSSANSTNSAASSSHFSSEIITGLLDKTRKLESEKLQLCEELDRSVEKIKELYKVNFDSDNLRDVLLTEYQKVESVFNSLKQLVEDKLSENPELLRCIQELESILAKVKSLSLTESHRITNDDLEHAYKQSTDLLAEVRSDITGLGTEDEEFNRMTLENTEVNMDNNDDGNENISRASETMTTLTTKTQGVDQWRSELRARRIECKQRIETIEATIRQKNDLLASLKAAAEQGDESYCLLLQKYESQVRELQSRISELELEKSRLLAEHNNEESKDTKIQKENLLKAMEQELIQTRRQLTELSRLKKAKEARETECIRLRTEIQSLKAQMIRSAKQLREESAAYRKWRKEKENEVRRLQQHDRRLQCEMSRMVSAHERQQAVLKRRIEAAAAAERRLKELLLRQRDVKQERDKRLSEVNNPKSKFDFAARIRRWIRMDLDIHVSMADVRYHLTNLIDSRKMVCDQLRDIERKIETCQPNDEQYDVYVDEVKSLTATIQSQTQQISDLQQKLIDAGERSSSTDAEGGRGGCVGASDSNGQISYRLAQLHNIQEARIALKYLFKECCDLKEQLQSKDKSIEQLKSHNDKLQKALQVALTSSVNACTDSRPPPLINKANGYLNTEDYVEDVKSHCQVTSKYLEKLQKENAELRELIAIQREDLAEMNLQLREMLNSRQAGTPVLRQNHNNNETFILPSNNNNDDDGENSNGCITNNDRNISPTFINKRSHISCNATDTDEPDSKVKKSESEENLHFKGEEEEENSNPTVNDDSQQRRCKCRGNCQSRCSCKRSGRLCTPANCHCLPGICQNRSTPPPTTTPTTGLDEDNEDLGLSLKSSTVMAPPSDVPRILRPKRKTRALQLNLSPPPQHQQQKKKSQPSRCLNETYDLDKKSSDTENEHCQLSTSPSSPDEITDASVVRHLWPKYRVSFFPSPSLTPDL
uniref:Kinesin motor domain-containing protein n=1 Tax=Trichobilharzia regenti TaxID=157069 RepID=A0AA85KC83_TRIRE|nr:unnamed protein product [Trichobilharzia regenti]